MTDKDMTGPFSELPSQSASIVSQEFNKIWNKGNLGAIEELYATDVEVHDPASSDIATGHAAYEAFLSSMLDSYSELEVVIKSVVDVEDLVTEGTTVGVHIIGTGRQTEQSGETVGIVGTHVFRIVDNQIVERWGGVCSRRAIEELRSEIYGRFHDHHEDDAFENDYAKVLLPGEEGYDNTRTLWNAMHDKYPLLIARCTNVRDIISAVDFAQENNLLIGAKGGGHNIAGKAWIHGGIGIDLSLMDGVHVDPDNRTARVEPGVRWEKLNHAAQQFDLATPGGIVSTTGVAGLTLGGGYGYLARKFGLSADNLLSVDLVTASGELITVSEDSHPELFKGIKGAGANFGIVSSFEFQLHPVGPEILGGALYYEREDAKKVLQYFREFVKGMPNELTIYGYFPMMQEYPALPTRSVEENSLFLLMVCYAGDLQEGEKVIQPLRENTDPIADTIKPTTLADIQDLGTKKWPPGQNNYWKSDNMNELPDDAIDTMMEYAKYENRSSLRNEINISPMKGAISDVNSDETAYASRDERYIIISVTNWINPEETEEHLDWATGLYEDLKPHFAETAYVNFIEDEGLDRVQHAYGENYDWLVDLKNEYDPENLFRSNQNIVPPVSE